MSTKKKRVTITAPPDTYKNFEEYRNERDLSKADAGRRLLREGLKLETQSTSTPQHTENLQVGQFRNTVMMMGAMLFGLAVYQLVTAGLTSVSAGVLALVALALFAFGLSGYDRRVAESLLSGR